MSNTLNIIHLPHRTDRYESLRHELITQGITDFKLHTGIIDKYNRKKGICQSHKSIVREAKENNSPCVIIAEDDIRFTELGAWKYYLSKMPESFDIYFSMIYVGQISEENKLVSQASGFTMYTIHERFYDTFLSIPDDCHIDRELTLKWAAYEFLVCPEFVCDQNGMRSDNNFKTTDYSPLLEKRKLYGRL